MESVTLLPITVSHIFLQGYAQSRIEKRVSMCIPISRCAYFKECIYIVKSAVFCPKLKGFSVYLEICSTHISISIWGSWSVKRLWLDDISQNNKSNIPILNSLASDQFFKRNYVSFLAILILHTDIIEIYRIWSPSVFAIFYCYSHQGGLPRSFPNILLSHWINRIGMWIDSSASDMTSFRLLIVLQIVCKCSKIRIHDT